MLPDGRHQTEQWWREQAERHRREAAKARAAGQPAIAAWQEEGAATCDWIAGDLAASTDLSGDGSEPRRRFK